MASAIKQAPHKRAAGVITKLQTKSISQIPEQDLQRRLTQLSIGTTSERTIGIIILINLAFLLIRPQYSLPIIGTLKITILLFLVSFVFWLVRFNTRWHKHFSLVMFLLVIHAIMIAISKFFPQTNLIANSGRAFLILTDLMQYLFCFILPLFVYLTFTKQFVRLNKLFIFCGTVLSLYSLTHSGRGPGGFLGDENDLGLMLVFLLPFPLFTITSTRGLFSKIFLLLIIVLILIASIHTNSRGTFIGLVCTLAFAFYHSKNKLATVAICLIGFISVLPFVSEEYIGEIKTITKTDEGTALTRMNYWKTALRATMDPRFSVQGVGLDNIPYRIEQYQGAGAGVHTRSFAGRQVHSMHVQILTDLGILGAIILISIFYRSIKNNLQCRTQIHHLEKTIFEIRKKISLINKELSQTTAEHSTINKLLPRDKQLRNISEELAFLDTFFNSLNAAWIAMLSAGSFISILYYPTPWLVIAISAAAYLHWKSKLPLLEEIVKTNTKLLKSTID